MIIKRKMSSYARSLIFPKKDITKSLEYISKIDLAKSIWGLIQRDRTIGFNKGLKAKSKCHRVSLSFIGNDWDRFITRWNISYISCSEWCISDSAFSMYSLANQRLRKQYFSKNKW